MPDPYPKLTYQNLETIHKAISLSKYQNWIKPGGIVLTAPNMRVELATVGRIICETCGKQFVWPHQALEHYNEEHVRSSFLERVFRYIPKHLMLWK